MAKNDHEFFSTQWILSQKEFAGGAFINKAQGIEKHTFVTTKPWGYKEILMKVYKLKSAHCVSAIALALGLSGPMIANAQEAESATAGDSEELVQGTVYVTARKRQETQLEVPVSVTAFSQANLDERGITDASELSEFVPGFDFENVGTGGASGRANPQLRFRGVGVQIGDANARAGAIFWDGAYVADGIGIVPLIDLAQTEVVKGPQTAFFGRNTFAGAANFIPAEPTDTFEGRVSASVTGTDVDNGYGINAIFSGPIVDKLSGRIALSQEKRGAAYKFQDNSPLGEEETFAILGSLRFDVSENTRIDYSGYFVDSEDTWALSSINADVAEGDCNQTYSGNLRDIVTGADVGPFSTDLSNLPGPVFDFATLTFLAADATLFCGSIPEWGGDSQINPAFGGAPPIADQDASGFTANVTLPEGAGFGSFISAPGGLGNTYETYRHHLSFETEMESGFTLAGFLSAGQNQNWGTFDNSYGASPIPSYRGFIRETEDQSAELRLSSPGDGRLRYTIGANYYTQEAQTYQTGFDILTTQEAEVLGIFGAVDFDITDELTISGEGRYQDDTSDLLQDGSPGSAFDPQSQSYSKFMPRVILSYEPRDLDLNIYGSWSQSYLAGTQTGVSSYQAATGLDLSGVAFFTPIQKLDAYEIGVKHQVNSQFQYAVAAYNMEWQNQAFFVLSPTFVSIALPGDSEYTGIETEATYSPTDWLTLIGSYNWVDGEFTDYVATGSVGASVLAPGLLTNTTAIDATGNKIRYIPEHTGAFSADFEIPVGTDTFARVDAIYTGSFFFDNFEYNEVDSAVKVNLRAGTSINDMFRVEAYGNNVFDDRTPETSGGTTFTSFFSQNTRRMFGQATRGTEWGIRLTADF